MTTLQALTAVLVIADMIGSICVLDEVQRWRSCCGCLKQGSLQVVTVLLWVWFLGSVRASGRVARFLNSARESARRGFLM